MTKILSVAALAAILFSGCASSTPTGALFTGVKLPISGNQGASGNKTGEASCMSLLGVLATGDCSVSTAAKNGGISTIQSVDFEATNFLGLIGTYTTVVKGN